MIRKVFLTDDDRKHLLSITRDKRESGGLVRRANAILLLNKGWSCTRISEAFFLDDDTIREWHKRFMEGGVDHLFTYDWKGRSSFLSQAQTENLIAWLDQTFPRDTKQVAAYISDRFSVDYSHAGIISLLHRIGFSYIRPVHVPKRVDEAEQRAFIRHYEDVLNRLEDDEVVLFADAVHPCHQSRPAKGWARKNSKPALRSNSARERINLQGALNLETFQFQFVEAEVVNAKSTQRLLERVENAYQDKRVIHVFADNARYHHAKILQPWLNEQNRRVKLHFIPPYCPHLNPIERLWGEMHRQVTHNRHYAKFKDFAEAILYFFKQQLPKNWEVWRDQINDNFRIVKNQDFRVLN
jgi:transposase